MPAASPGSRKRVREGSAAGSSSSSVGKGRVRFSHVDVRTFGIEVWGGGGVPADDGPPLGLSWDVKAETQLELDAYEDERFDPAWDVDRGLRTRNALSVPVHDHGGRLLGVVECINRFDGVFDEDDKELVQGLAAQLGLARMVSD